MATSRPVVLLIFFSLVATSSYATPAADEAKSTGSPINVDPALDCAIRELAWDFAKKLLPQRGEFKSAYDALRLNNCGVSVASGRRYERNAFRYQPQVSSDATEIYVATNGDDSKPGTLNEPVQSLQKAVELYRRQKGISGGVIYVREGTYYLTETLQLGPEDSNLVITGYENERPVISGGKEYELNWREIGVNEIEPDLNNVNAMFGTVSQPGESNNRVAFYGKVSSYMKCRDACAKNQTCFAYTWYERGRFAEMCYFRIDGLWVPTSEDGIHSGKKLHIIMADLTGQDPKNFSTFFLNQRRAVRARYPDGNPETMGLYTSPTGYVPTAKRWLPPEQYSPAQSICIKSPERNGTHFPYFQLGIGGPVQVFDPPESFWGVNHPGIGTVFSALSGLEYSSDEWIANQDWARPGTGVVHAFQGLHWGNWQFAVDGQDKDKNLITWSKGGFQEARGASYLFRTGAEWYVENIRELLDAPGEWYYDDHNSSLFYYPNQTVYPTSGVGTFLEQLIFINGSMDNPVKNIAIINMSFTQTEPTYLDKYEVPSGGDWSIHRGGTVFVEGVEGFLLQNCTFNSPGGNALFLSNYVRRAVIEGNEFVYTGDSAIAAVGSTDLINGTLGTQPRGTKVIGNLMHEIGIWGKQTAGYFQAVAAETELYGNVIFNGPRAGINFNDGFGGGNLVEMNLVFNMVRETIDHGPINSWDRQPYLTKVKDGTPSLTPAQSNITRNFIICNYHSIYPIDHDDGSCCYHDTHNYLVYGGYKNYIGYNKIVKYNVYIYPDAINIYNFIDLDYGTFLKPFCASSGGTFPRGEVDEWANNTCVIGSSNVYKLYSCSEHTNNAERIPFTANNSLYVPNGEIYIQCNRENWSLQAFQDKGYGIGTQVYDPVDCDTIVNWGKELLGLSFNDSICQNAAAAHSAIMSICIVPAIFLTLFLL